jgi:hypothetical protein
LDHSAVEQGATAGGFYFVQRARDFAGGTMKTYAHTAFLLNAVDRPTGT